MKPKNLVTIALLGFVGISLGAIVVKEMRPEHSAPIAEPAQEPPAVFQTAPPDAERPTHVVAYYFYGDVRCTTCVAIESQSHKAITSLFADQLESGEMEWRLVNYDMPENEHFRDDFQLAFQSLVLVEERGDEVVRWQNLSDVWTWIHETPEEFEEYVVISTADFLAGDAT